MEPFFYSDPTLTKVEVVSENIINVQQGEETIQQIGISQTVQAVTDGSIPIDKIQLQWFLDGEAVVGATQTTFDVLISHYGKTLTVTADFTTIHVESEPIFIGNTAPTAQNLVTGLNRVGNILTINPNTIQDADGIASSFSYRWYVDDVQQAYTGTTFSLLTSHFNKTVKGAVLYTDSFGKQEIIFSDDFFINRIPPTGYIEILGTPKVFQRLTVNTSNLADLNGFGNGFSYQWYANSIPLASQTNSFFDITSQEYGKQITVTATYTDSVGDVESVISSPITVINTPATGYVEILGTPEQGQTLTANPIDIADDNVINSSFTYQWKRNGSNISSATQSTYVVGANDYNTNITVALRFYDSGGNLEEITSDPVYIINSSPTGEIVIDGSVKVGESLVVNAQDIEDPNNISENLLNDSSNQYTYTRYHSTINDGLVVSTSPSLVTETVGTVFSIVGSYHIGEVTFSFNEPINVSYIAMREYKGQFGSKYSSLSSATVYYKNELGNWVAVAGKGGLYLDPAYHKLHLNAPITAREWRFHLETSPHASGKTIVGARATFFGEPAQKATIMDLQWYADGEAIEGANSHIYTPTFNDFGKILTVSASYVDAQGNTEYPTSNTEILVNNAPPEGTLLIAGNTNVGDTLYFTHNITDRDNITEQNSTGLISEFVSYQWYKADSSGDVPEPIVGATESTLLLTQDLEAKYISLSVTYVDSEGDDDTVYSSNRLPVRSPPTGYPQIEYKTSTGTMTILDTTVAIGSTLFANSSSIQDSNDLGEFSYQWKRDDFVIENETKQYYTVQNEDTGADITVTISYTDGDGYSEQVTSLPNMISPLNNNTKGDPIILGTPEIDNTLSVDVTELLDIDNLSVVPVSYYKLFSNTRDFGVNLFNLTTTNNLNHSFEDGGLKLLSNSSFLETANIFTLNNNYNSISVMVNLYQSPTQDTTLLTYGSNPQLFINSSRQLKVGYAGTVQTVNNSTLTLNQWYHLCLVKNGTTLKIYLDGNLIDTKTVSLVSAQQANTKLRLGAYSSWVSSLVKVKDLQVFDFPVDQRVEVSSYPWYTEPTYSYQWKNNGNVIAGATSDTYEINSNSQIGEVLTVEVSHVDQKGNNNSVISSKSVVVVNSDAEGTLSISGTPKVGETLTLDASITDPNTLSGDVSYSWLSNNSLIEGENSSTYVVRQDDVLKDIRGRILVTDNAGRKYSFLSSELAIINTPAVGTATITGIPKTGRLLSVEISLVEPNIILYPGFRYLWKRNGVTIANETNASYEVRNEDIGKNITVQVSYVDNSGTTESFTSDPIVGLNSEPTGYVEITGQPSVASILTADVSSISDPNGFNGYSFQWKRDGQNIAGATLQTYLVTEQDYGKEISVSTTYIDQAGYTETPILNNTVKILKSGAFGTVTITGTAKPWYTLTIEHDVSDAEGVQSISYQWYANALPILGETNQTFQIPYGYEGFIIKARVTCVDLLGDIDSIYSQEVGVQSPVYGTISIVGTPQTDQTLTVDIDGLSDVNGIPTQLEYQWMREEAGVYQNIQAATSSSYVVTNDDINKNIKVVVSYTDNAGFFESVESEPVIGLNTLSQMTTSFEGSLVADSMIKATISNINDPNTVGELSYQWYADDQPVNSYVVTAPMPTLSTSSLEVYYNVKGNASTNSLDSLYGDTTGSLSNGASINGDYVELDGNNDYIGVANTFLANPGQTFTLSTLVYLQPNVEAILFSNMDVNMYSSTLGMELYYTGNSLNLVKGAGYWEWQGVWPNGYGIANITTEGLYLITLVSNDSGNIKLYINNNLVYNTGKPTFYFSGRTASVRIGSRYMSGNPGYDGSNGTRYKPGKMSMFAAWSRALSSVEVEELYDSVQNPVETNISYPLHYMTSITDIDKELSLVVSHTDGVGSVETISASAGVIRNSPAAGTLSAYADKEGFYKGNLAYLTIAENVSITYMTPENEQGFIYTFGQENTSAGLKFFHAVSGSAATAIIAYYSFNSLYTIRQDGKIAYIYDRDTNILKQYFISGSTVTSISDDNSNFSNNSDGSTGWVVSDIVPLSIENENSFILRKYKGAEYKVFKYKKQQDGTFEENELILGQEDYSNGTLSQSRFNSQNLKFNASHTEFIQYQDTYVNGVSNFDFCLYSIDENYNVIKISTIKQSNSSYSLRANEDLTKVVIGNEVYERQQDNSWLLVTIPQTFTTTLIGANKDLSKLYYRPSTSYIYTYNKKLNSQQYYLLWNSNITTNSIWIKNDDNFLYYSSKTFVSASSSGMLQVEERITEPGVTLNMYSNEITDLDGINSSSIQYSWYYDDELIQQGSNSSLTVDNDVLNKRYIKAEMTYEDLTGKQETVSTKLQNIVPSYGLFYAYDINNGYYDENYYNYWTVPELRGLGYAYRRVYGGGDNTREFKNIKCHQNPPSVSGYQSGLSFSDGFYHITTSKYTITFVMRPKDLSNKYIQVGQPIVYFDTNGFRFAGVDNPWNYNRTITTNDFYIINVVRENGYYKMYVNGEYVAGGNARSNDYGNVNINPYGDWQDFTFTSAHNYALSNQEILDIYNKNKYFYQIEGYRRISVVDENLLTKKYAKSGTSFALDFDTMYQGFTQSQVIQVSLVGGLQLPSWLSYNSSTKVLSGTPTDSDSGTLKVSFKVIDADGVFEDVVTIEVLDSTQSLPYGSYLQYDWLGVEDPATVVSTYQLNSYYSNWQGKFQWANQPNPQFLEQAVLEDSFDNEDWPGYSRIDWGTTDPLTVTGLSDIAATWEGKYSWANIPNAQFLEQAVLEESFETSDWPGYTRIDWGTTNPLTVTGLSDIAATWQGKYSWTNIPTPTFSTQSVLEETFETPDWSGYTRIDWGTTNPLTVTGVSDIAATWEGKYSWTNIPKPTFTEVTKQLEDSFEEDWKI